MKNKNENETTIQSMYANAPFPLSLEAQRRLLDLIYERKSGIISRQELVDVIFNPKSLDEGTIIRYRQ